LFHNDDINLCYYTISNYNINTKVKKKFGTTVNLVKKKNKFTIFVDSFFKLWKNALKNSMNVN